MKMWLMCLRAGAVAIAIAGAIDPVWSLMRTAQPEVAVVVADRLPDPALADRVAALFQKRFRVSRAPAASSAFGAAAVVLVGDELPAGPYRDTPVAVAIQPQPARPFATIVGVDVPARSQLNSNVPVTARVRVMAAAGGELTMTLRSQGVAIDRATKKIAGADVTETVELTLVPSVEGRLPFTVTAEVTGGRDVHSVDVATAVHRDRWTILAFDRRPSWMATFVRRAIEADPRFVVTSRIATSRGTAATSGRPPESLATLSSLEHFDAVLIGTPDELTMADAASLDSYMRKDGGSVVLLMDEPVASPALRQLTGISAWRATSAAKPTGVPPATEFFAPERVGLWLSHTGPVADMSVGQGHLFISTALDAWRYRGTDATAFDRFWRLLVAKAGVRPGSDLTAAGPSGIGSDDRSLIRAWTASHNGRVLSEHQLAQLVPSLEAALSPARERTPVYPLRSGWWIVPFGALLGAEWWLRRRQGLR